MSRPEFLNTVTIGQTRQKYRDNVKALDNILELVLSGSLEEAKEIAGEWVINRTITEIIIQQEYIREREKANWGWDRGDVDFSKQKNCILNCNETA
ncbi:MAG: hypothetical protein ACLVDG_00620 [Coprococcus sp.]|uniref:Uncharacterized protein n=1 Tax=Coprococcus catus GD/7 TaxID=717962 RepID=D4J8L3_9FIRM|nr:hypothetical protein [Coprococcus catus]CBK80684.1 hypothetical protein CC1_19530 [Coprococcus catus GD/7]